MTLREEIKFLSEGKDIDRLYYDRQKFYAEKAVRDSGKPLAYQVWYDSGSIHYIYFKSEETAKAFINNLENHKLEGKFKNARITSWCSRPTPVVKTSKIKTFYDEYGNKEN